VAALVRVQVGGPSSSSSLLLSIGGGGALLWAKSGLSRVHCCASDPCPIITVGGERQRRRHAAAGE
jgi:hypothetical protein